LVASLNRPGGNITGALTIELDPKRLELLHEITPSKGPFGVLFNPTRPDSHQQIETIKAAAQAAGREPIFAPSHTPKEFEDAFGTFARHSVVGVLVAADPFFPPNASRSCPWWHATGGLRYINGANSPMPAGWRAMAQTCLTPTGKLVSSRREF
jgi:ABC transporter substrate binding protein